MKLTFLPVLLGAALLAGACSREETSDARQDVTQSTQAAASAADDAWVTTKVEAKFFGSSEVKGRQIDVSTEAGVVTLAGRVDTEIAKQQALALARGTEGVREVRDQLRVAPSEVAATTGTTLPGATSDTSDPRPAADAADSLGSAWTTTKIQAQFFADDEVKARDIDVTTRNGRVTLTGQVESDAQRQKAVQIARSTEGVTDVEDRLRVGPMTGEATSASAAGGERLSDDQLTARVQSKFYQDDSLRRSSIDVRSENGVVTLGGVVASEARKRQAAAMTARVEGVTAVRDELRVDPTVPPLRGAERDTGQAARQETGALADGWITTKIQARFYLDPDIKGRKVDVSTSNGVVTLTGVVDNDAMRQEAVAIAKETDDVVRVTDKLTVRPQGGG